jgi:4-hydroxybenzoate polyprenyltransferase
MKPIAVDLDGSLIYTDILYETFLNAFSKNPFIIFYLLFWILGGKANLKSKLAELATIEVSSLPFNFELINWLKQQKTLGRKLVLCTASHHSVARDIASHLDLFDEVMASNGRINLSGDNKASALVEKFGHQGFDYVGNSQVDLLVWTKSHKIILVNGSKDLVNKLKKMGNIELIFSGIDSGFKEWIKAFRLHQWIKNLLIFIPILAAHALITIDNVTVLLLAFLSFSLCASSVYISNDLLDLESDRRHLRKRNRPFASGSLPILIGLILAPLLLIISLIIASFVNKTFLYWLIIYFLITGAYSLWLKRVVLVDCFTLAQLYTLRIVAGAAAVDVPLSFWLLAFSIFLFLSLAFIKRCAELHFHSRNMIEFAHGRGYLVSDLSFIQQLGISSGFLAVLVLALYLNSDNVVRLYENPEFIWLAVPLILFWISWMWLQVHRGKMHDDPIVFAIKDKVSIFVGLFFILIFIIAS